MLVQDFLWDLPFFPCWRKISVVFTKENTSTHAAWRIVTQRITMAFICLFWNIWITQQQGEHDNFRLWLKFSVSVEWSNHYALTYSKRLEPWIWKMTCRITNSRMSLHSGRSFLEKSKLPVKYIYTFACIVFVLNLSHRSFWNSKNS